jgi:hypothetical protein
MENMWKASSVHPEYILNLIRNLIWKTISKTLTFFKQYVTFCKNSKENKKFFFVKFHKQSSDRIIVDMGS